MKPKLKAWEPPYIGKQTEQEYHPERGAQFAVPVSTYGGDMGWIISFCSIADVAKTKKNDLSRVKT